MCSNTQSKTRCKWPSKLLCTLCIWVQEPLATKKQNASSMTVQSVIVWGNVKICWSYSGYLSSRWGLNLWKYLVASSHLEMMFGWTLVAMLSHLQLYYGHSVKPCWEYQTCLTIVFSTPSCCVLKLDMWRSHTDWKLARHLRQNRFWLVSAGLELVVKLIMIIVLDLQKSWSK